MKQARRDTKSSGTRLAGKSPCTAIHRTRRPNPVRDGGFGCDAQLPTGLPALSACICQACVRGPCVPFAESLFLLWRSLYTHSRYPPPPPASGFSAPIKGYVQAGEATLCKKPYAVCDYPNGDVFVRHALQVWTCLFSCLCAVAAMMTATHRSHGLMSRKYKSESQTRNACRR
jgi:hypothetical protein